MFKVGDLIEIGTLGKKGKVIIIPKDNMGLYLVEMDDGSLCSTNESNLKPQRASNTSLFNMASASMQPTPAPQFKVGDLVDWAHNGMSHSNVAGQVISMSFDAPARRYWYDVIWPSGQSGMYLSKDLIASKAVTPGLSTPKFKLGDKVDYAYNNASHSYVAGIITLISLAGPTANKTLISTKNFYEVTWSNGGRNMYEEGDLVASKTGTIPNGQSQHNAPTKFKAGDPVWTDVNSATGAPIEAEIEYAYALVRGRPQQYWVRFHNGAASAMVEEDDLSARFIVTHGASSTSVPASKFSIGDRINVLSATYHTYQGEIIDVDAGCWPRKYDIKLDSGYVMTMVDEANISAVTTSTGPAASLPAFKLGDKVRIPSYWSQMDTGVIEHLLVHNGYSVRMDWDSKLFDCKEADMILVISGGASPSQTVPITMGTSTSQYPTEGKNQNVIGLDTPVCQCAMEKHGFASHSPWCDCHPDKLLKMPS